MARDSQSINPTSFIKEVGRYMSKNCVVNMSTGSILWGAGVLELDLLLKMGFPNAEILRHENCPHVDKKGKVSPEFLRNNWRIAGWGGLFGTNGKIVERLRQSSYTQVETRLKDVRVIIQTRMEEQRIKPPDSGHQNILALLRETESELTRLILKKKSATLLRSLMRMTDLWNGLLTFMELFGLPNVDVARTTNAYHLRCIDVETDALSVTWMEKNWATPSWSKLWGVKGVLIMNSRRLKSTAFCDEILAYGLIILGKLFTIEHFADFKKSFQETFEEVEFMRDVAAQVQLKAERAAAERAAAERAAAQQQAQLAAQQQAQLAAQQQAQLAANRNVAFHLHLLRANQPVIQPSNSPVYYSIIDNVRFYEVEYNQALRHQINVVTNWQNCNNVQFYNIRREVGLQWENSRRGTIFHEDAVRNCAFYIFEYNEAVRAANGTN